MSRPSFHQIMLDMATLVAKRSTCVRLQVGTVIASTDFRKILAMGYNGNASDLPNKCDLEGPEASGRCGCLHSEENAIINCDVPRQVKKLVYVTHLPCLMCAKRLINLGGVQSVVFLQDYRLHDAVQVLESVGITVSRYEAARGTIPELFHRVESK